MGKRVRDKLAALTLKKKPPGMHGDGGGLWLQVTSSGARSWIFRFTRNGRTRDMGLGSLEDVSLEKARERAAKARGLLLDGIDPIEDRIARDAQQRAAEASLVTFQRCAEDYIEDRSAEWKNAKHREQWRSTLATYAYPKIGGLAVAMIEPDHVYDVLRPIWTSKNETASRVRGRIEAVLAFATVKKRRTGENPARWRGNLDQMLAKPAKVKKVEHHAALGYADVPTFMARLRQQRGNAARALEFAILTAARTGEVLGATWSEFDLEAGIWTVPADRMKAGKEHKVPLSERALRLVKAQEGADATFVFPGRDPAQPLSNMAMLATLKRMDRKDVTTHGFRSTFRDWCAETTNHPGFVAEMALAHTIASNVEKAYRRGDLFAKRAVLMRDWAEYCHRDPNHKATVTSLMSKTAA